MLNSVFSSKFITKYIHGILKHHSTKGRCHCREMSSKKTPKWMTYKEVSREKLVTTQPGLLETWLYGVERFGKIHISVPFSLNIESLDPHEYPEMGKLVIKMTYSPDSDSGTSEQYDNTSLTALTKLYNFDIDLSQTDNIKIVAKYNTMARFPAVCTVQMPLNYDLDVECQGNSTSVKNFESDKINISTSNSLCTLHNIKGEYITVQSKDGDIICTKVIQGNINMAVTGFGSIKTDRLQGQSIKCSVEEGNMNISSAYSTASEFISRHGNINLMNVHGASKIFVNHGDLVLDSLDGSLESEVRNGRTDIFIARAEDVALKAEKGDIDIKLSEQSTSIDLEGISVICDQKLNFIDLRKDGTETGEKLQGNLSGTGGKIKAKTINGNITVKYMDWMESLKLQTKFE